MAVFKVLLIVPAMLVMKTAADDGCYAPPLVYGGECKASTSIFGSPGLKVHYSVDQVNNAGTLICCQALGCNFASSTDCSTWEFYGIGCSSSSISAAVLWGNNAATPAIKCYGSPTGTSLKWSSSAVSTPKHNHL